MEEQEPFTFKKLSLKRFPQVEGKESGEDGFWRRFKFPVIVKEYAAISSVHFEACEPYDYAVTTGSRVQVYSGVTNQVKKTISRFREAAYSGCFRGDGKLLAAGSEDGAVKIFDVGSRAILRSCRGHRKPCRSVRFSLDGLKLMSGSDDATLRYWDMATESAIATLKGHEDYVRGVLPSPASIDLILSGSYDHTLKFWDLRSGTSVMQMDHGAPVESILMFPSGGTCVSAGGHAVKVWDLLGGGRLLLTICNHSKTITSLSFDGTCRRLLSGGLDKYVKVYSVEDYRVIHSLSYPAPILSVAMSPSDNHLVVGMTSRLLSIRHKVKPREEAESALSVPDQPRPGTHRYFIRGRDYKPSADDYVFTQTRKTRLQQYEQFLKRFKYKDALSAALKGQRRNPVVVYSLLQELVRRDGLSVAVSGRNERELLPLLGYLVRHLVQQRFSDLLLDVCCIVVDVYGQTLWESVPVRKKFQRLKQIVDKEMKFQAYAYELLGSLDVILTAAMATQRQSGTTVADQRTSDSLSKW